MAKRDREERRRAIRSARETTEQMEAGYTPTSFKLPKDVKRFALKKGRNRIDIIPYEVGAGNPRADEGSVHWERSFYIHRGVGPTKEAVCCLARTFGKKCPVCEEIARLDRDPEASQKEVKDLLPKWRQLFNVIDLDAPDDGIQVMEMSYYLFGELLSERINASEEEDGWDLFHSPTEGLTLYVTGSEDTMGQGKPFIRASAIDFKERRKPYPESIIDEAYCLDELLVEKDYDELQALFREMQDDKPKEDDAPPARRRGRAAADDDLPPEEDAPPARRRRGAPPPEDDIPMDDAPPPRRGRAAAPPPEDDDANWDDPTPPRRRGRAETQEELPLEDEAPKRRGRAAAPVEEEEDAPPPRRRGRAVEPEEDEGVADDPPPRRRGRAAPPPEDDEQPAPKRGKRSSAFDDDDEDEAPPPRRRRASVED